jgi:hypothetical protein
MLTYSSADMEFRLNPENADLQQRPLEKRLTEA